MKIGVKIWPDKAEYAYEIAEHVDFIEIMAKRGEDFSFLEGIELPFVVHAEHHHMGVNYADSSKIAQSRKSLEFAIRLADKLDARMIIVHPGYLDGLSVRQLSHDTSTESTVPNQSAENVIEFLKGINDNRIVLENLPIRETVNGGLLEHPFSTPEGLRDLLLATNKGMCLDLSHAQVTASILGLNCIELLEKFMELKPRHFHACGGVECETKDTHMHLWEGNLNIEAFKRMLPKTAWVTLETPCDLEGQLRDIEIMRR